MGNRRLYDGRKETNATQNKGQNMGSRESNGLWRLLQTSQVSLSGRKTGLAEAVHLCPGAVSDIGALCEGTTGVFERLHH